MTVETGVAILTLEPIPVEISALPFFHIAHALQADTAGAGLGEAFRKDQSANCEYE